MTLLLDALTYAIFLLGIAAIVYYLIGKYQDNYDEHGKDDSDDGNES